jgi:hypothetical protein
MARVSPARQASPNLAYVCRREALAQFPCLPPANVGQIAVKDPMRERPGQIGDVLPVPRPQNIRRHPLDPAIP